MTVGKPFDDGEGNHVTPGPNARRPRRVPSPATTLELPSEPHLTPQSNPPDTSNDMEIDESDIAPPGSLPEKTMTFGMGIRRNPQRRVKLSVPRRNTTHNARRMSTVEPGQAVAIIDTGGGARPTITTKAWEILGGDADLTTQMQPYQSAKSISCRVWCYSPRG